VSHKITTYQKVNKKAVRKKNPYGKSVKKKYADNSKERGKNVFMEIVEKGGNHKKEKHPSTGSQ